AWTGHIASYGPRTSDRGEGTPYFVGPNRLEPQKRKDALVNPFRVDPHGSGMQKGAVRRMPRSEGLTAVLHLAASVLVCAPDCRRGRHPKFRNVDATADRCSVANGRFDSQVRHSIVQTVLRATNGRGDQYRRLRPEPNGC